MLLWVFKCKYPTKITLLTSEKDAEMVGFIFRERPYE